MKVHDRQADVFDPNHSGYGVWRVAGAVGAEDRLTYTVHGDAVNRAARVEAMNKELGTKILVSETTRELLQEITVCEVGVLDVRGQSSAVTVYTIEAQNS